MSAWASRSAFSGVTITRWSFLSAIVISYTEVGYSKFAHIHPPYKFNSLLGGSHLLRLFFGFFDHADVHERTFGQVVPFAVAEFFEAADRFGERGHVTRFAGERFGHEERLRQE